MFKLGLTFLLVGVLVTVSGARASQTAIAIRACVSVLRSTPHTDLFPEIPENKVKKTWMRVTPEQELYVEESGNPKGKTVLFLHGGPGVGAKPGFRRYFDPALWRIIILSQRGSPPNKTPDPLKDNTTWDLIRDLEQLRVEKGIQKWDLVFGGSWGSTLSLAYAETHPDRVASMVLRGIYLARPQDSDWYFHNEQDPATAWPEWKNIHALVDKNSPKRMDEQLLKLVTSPDKATRLKAKRAWLEYGDSIYNSDGKPDTYTDAEVEANPNPPMEAMYGLKNAFFPTPNYLIENIAKVRHIPTVIVHGVSDRITPVGAAVDLSHVWPEAEVILVPGSGHAAEEPGTQQFLVDATNRFAHSPRQ